MTGLEKQLELIDERLEASIFAALKTRWPSCTVLDEHRQLVSVPLRSRCVDVLVEVDTNEMSYHFWSWVVRVGGQSQASSMSLDLAHFEGMPRQVVMNLDYFIGVVVEASRRTREEVDLRRDI